jgi:hypothetical protein
VANLAARYFSLRRGSSEATHRPFSTRRRRVSHSCCVGKVRSTIQRESGASGSKSRTAGILWNVPFMVVEGWGCGKKGGIIKRQLGSTSAVPGAAIESFAAHADSIIR